MTISSCERSSSAGKQSLRWGLVPDCLRANPVHPQHKWGALPLLLPVCRFATRTLCCMRIGVVLQNHWINMKMFLKHRNCIKALHPSQKWMDGFTGCKSFQFNTLSFIILIWTVRLSLLKIKLYAHHFWHLLERFLKSSSSSFILLNSSLSKRRHEWFLHAWSVCGVPNCSA